MPESIFLAERYIARLDAAEVRALAGSLTVATAAMRAEGHRIRWVRSYGVLGDEACPCVFLADNVADVEEANRRAGAEWERIIPASCSKTSSTDSVAPGPRSTQPRLRGAGSVAGSDRGGGAGRPTGTDSLSSLAVVVDPAGDRVLIGLRVEQDRRPQTPGATLYGLPSISAPVLASPRLLGMATRPPDRRSSHGRGF